MDKDYSDFYIENKDDGMYITLFCQDKEFTTYNRVNNYLTSNGILKFDKKALKRAIGLFKPTILKLSDSQCKEIDEYIGIDYSEDRVHAYLVFYPRTKGGKEIEITEIYDRVQKEAIVEGLDQGKIEEAVVKKKCFVSYEIATGIEPRECINPSLKYLFKTDLEDVRAPKIKDDGSVDYYSIEIINPVKEGQAIAKISEGIAGENGVTVHGEEIIAKEPVNVTFRISKNVTVSEDGLTAYASTDGQATLINGKIAVVNMQVIEGDVDAKTGNIAFNGCVAVKGSIRSGFKVEAEGDVQVDGTVEGAIINAKGNVLVKRGIQGMKKGNIVAGGNIIARFVENARVVAMDSVSAEAILYSNVIARNKIIVKDKKGLIVGGEIYGGQYIECKSIGSAMGANTVVEIGASEITLCKIESLKEQLKGLLVLKKKAIQVVKYCKENDISMLSEEQKVKIKKIINKNKSVKQEIEHVKRSIELLESAYNNRNDVDNMILVNGVIYQDVKLTVNGVSLIVRDSQKNIMITEKNEELQIDAF